MSRKFVVFLMCVLVAVGLGVYLRIIPGWENQIEIGNRTQSASISRTVLSAQMTTDFEDFRFLQSNNSNPIILNPESDYIEIRGQQRVQGKTQIPINPEKLYYMTLELSVPADQSAKSVDIYAGFVIFDGNKKQFPATAKPHRFFVSNKKSLKVVEAKKEKWETLSGIITETNKNSHSAFHSGTTLAAPYLILNYRDDNAVTRIRKIEVQEFE